MVRCAAVFDCLSRAGVSGADRATMEAAFRDTWAQPAWKTPFGQRLRTKVVGSLLVHARHHKHWSRENRWVRAFDGFARRYAATGGTPYASPRAARADDALNEMFIAAVASQDRGVSVPGAARRALSAKRKREGGTSLNGNEFISLVVGGAKRAKPTTPSQAADVPLSVVRALADKILVEGRREGSWFDEMVVTMVLVGIVSLMRLIEIRSAQWAGLRFILLDGGTLTVRAAANAPGNQIRGLHIHVAWRKSTQDADCWVPVSCARSIRAILDHWRRLQRLGYRGTLVFPARVSSSKAARPNDANWIGPASFIKRFRALLRENRLMSARAVHNVRGHSLRVTGSNLCRRRGVPADAHRLMGGWQSLTSAAGYMAMTPNEQFRLTDRLALQQKRRAAFTGDQATAAFVNLPQL